MTAPVSNLCLQLYRSFATGALPATAVQRLAKSAWDDGWGWADAGLCCRLRDCTSKEEAMLIVATAWDYGRWGPSKSGEDLAKVGTGGAHTQNIQRDILRAAERSEVMKSLPSLYYFNARGPAGPVHHAMYLPHETLHSVLANSPADVFDLTPNDGKLGGIGGRVVPAPRCHAR